ncbi:MAG: tetratricopeptide repeat protein, partial [Candidatus Dadabacteria bacterium]|nr:tetratricopeptide repeat protein [Candidatus Dadabacteria bacterium]
MSTENAENKLTSRPPVRKFSPGMYQSDEELISQFVVRNHELKIVLEILHENIESSSCQHVLIVAPRGRGKTMLLSRVAAELRVNDKFSKSLLPVQFMEESQEIFTLADFWLETLFHLAREIAAYNPELAQELRETHTALIDRWQEREIGDHARATVLATADQLGRKLVLMVENLQALSRSVDGDFGWRLREVLQSEPQIMLLASATSWFESLEDVEQPFFELFRITSLEQLTTEDCRRLWEVVSGKEASAREIRPLEILTGGSPRLLVIIADFARHGSMHQLMEELVTLIDEHTEYFRNHLENFPRMERRVYLAIIDLWQPSKPGEIAARARMDVRTVSTMLGRLVNRGAVITDGSTNKRLYVAAERLYSIYYKLRRERDEAAVVKNLIYFMAVFYNESELSEMSRNLIAEATQSKTIREGIKRAIAERLHTEDEFSSIKWQTIRQIFNQALENYKLMNKQLIEEEINIAFREKDPKRVIKIADQALNSQDVSLFPMSESDIAFLLNKKILAYGYTDDFKAAITTCNEVIKSFGNNNAPALQWHVASAMIGKAEALGKLDDFKAASMAYNEGIKHFNAPALQWHVASAMVGKAEALGKLDDFKAAIIAYDEVIKHFGNNNAPYLQREVAWAMLFRGYSLEELNDSEAAITTYDEVIKRFADTPDMQWQVASAMVGKGNILEKLNEFQAAITTYDEVIERFVDTPDIRRQVASAMAGKGKALEKLDDFQTAITTYDEMIERFVDTPDMQGPIAWIMVDKANALEKFDDFQTAIATYDKMIERFTDAPKMQGPVAWARLFKAYTLQSLNDFEAAITTYDEIIERFTAAPEL